MLLSSIDGKEGNFSRVESQVDAIQDSSHGCQKCTTPPHICLPWPCFQLDEEIELHAIEVKNCRAHAPKASSTEVWARMDAIVGKVSLNLVLTQMSWDICDQPDTLV